MKHLYLNGTLLRILKRSAVLIFILSSLLTQAQIRQVNLSVYQGCNGATIIPFPLFTTSTTTPVTIYYERLVGADTWNMEASQVFSNITSYQVFSGSDLNVPTTYRVRAIDGITNAEYISNSVSVNPNTWNADRGTATATAIASWGSTCSNNWIAINFNYTSRGRPPFRVLYKKSTDNDYIEWGTTANGAVIENIEAGPYYNIQLIDQCGKVINTSARLEIQGAYTINQPPTTCENGKITLGPNPDARYAGVPPYTYAFQKYNPNRSEPMEFGTQNVFENLGPGLYMYYIKDACGNQSAYRDITFAESFAQANATMQPGTDACNRTLTINISRGRGPFKYGTRHQDDPNFTWQNTNTLLVTKPGNYYYQVISACDDTSAINSVPLILITPSISSVNEVAASSTCFKNMQVSTNSGGNTPFEYGIRKAGSGNFVYQTSALFTDLPAGNYEFSVKDRCGIQSTSYPLNIITGTDCALRTTPGDFEIANSTQGCPQNVQGSDWIDMRDDNGNLIFSINPSSNALGAVCWGVRIVQGSGTARNGQVNNQQVYYLNRNFYIEPTNATLLDPVSIRIYFTDAEMQELLNYFNNTLGLSYTMDDLAILKKSGSAGSPTDLEVTNNANASAGQFTWITPVIKPYGHDWYMEYQLSSFSEFNPGITPANSLPLKFVSFTATKQSKGVQLKWTTTDEMNTDRIESEWSTGNGFSKIGTGPSFNTEGNHMYGFLHISPADGINYYRLKQVDKDGRFTYSSIVPVQFNDDKVLTLAPNPAQHQVEIRFRSGLYRSLKIVDATGRTVMQRVIGQNDIRALFQIQSLTPGIYVAVLEGNNNSQLRFMKY